MRAARVEMTSRRRVERRRDLARDRCEIMFSLIQSRHVGQQRLRLSQQTKHYLQRGEDTIDRGPGQGHSLGDFMALFNLH